MYILGIESSCDETACAIIDNDKNVLSHKVYSQIEEHKIYGGVVPEIAARNHLNILPDIINQTIKESNICLKDIDLFCATSGPGLIAGLGIATVTAKTFSLKYNKPYISVNHLEGHALCPRFEYDNLKFPYLLLLISGGNTQIVIVKGVGDYEIIGRTLDDAVGECFDKVGKMLKLPYPGGPNIEKISLNADSGNFSLPRPMIHKKNCEMSFSGIKTRVSSILNDWGDDDFNEKNKSQIAYEFQKAISETLASKLFKAFEIYTQKYTNLQLVVSGGVAANKFIKDVIIEKSSNSNFEVFYPKHELCTDNAIMIAWAGYENYTNNIKHNIDFPVMPRWDLESIGEKNEK